MLAAALGLVGVLVPGQADASQTARWTCGTKTVVADWYGGFTIERPSGKFLVSFQSSRQERFGTGCKRVAPTNELKAMLGVSEKFFLVAHVEKGGDAYLKYSTRYCTRR